MNKIADQGRKYKYVGHQVPGTKVDRILLSGTSANPEHYIDLNGDSVELTDADHKRLTDQGYRLHKTAGPPLEEDKPPKDDSKSSDDKSKSSEESK